MRPIVAAALLAGTGAAGAQMLPPAVPLDQRIQSVSYAPDQVVALQVSPGFELSIAFAPGERIESVAVGDSGAWQVAPNKRGDLLFIKMNDGATSTNMTVVTDARTYLFDLAPASGGAPVYLVRFIYATPSAPELTTTSTEPVKGRYKLLGAKDIRPAGINDDGERTYVRWRPDQQQPAIFAIDARGQETLTNGAMREGVYVVDSVAPRLIFRLDKKTATATRLRPTAQ